MGASKQCPGVLCWIWFDLIGFLSVLSGLWIQKVSKCVRPESGVALFVVYCFNLCAYCFAQLPKLLELVGLGYTAWFVYRYLLFKVRFKIQGVLIY